MKVAVLYQSRTGNTRHAAELIGKAALKLGATEAGMWPVTNVDHHALAEADLVFVGTWVDGIVIAGHRPGQTGKLMQMPALHNKKVAVFMTYALHAGNVLEAFSGWLYRQKGADVVAATALKRSNLSEAKAEEFVKEAFVARGVQFA